MPDVHAVVSASSAFRWLNCTPSVRMCEAFENTSSEAAMEGTAAHALAEWKLHKLIGDEVGEKPTSPYDCKEMEYHTDGYVAFVSEKLEEAKQFCKEPLLLIEQRLDFSQWVPEGFGTGDAVIIADSIVYIIDLKYGKGVEVDATDNPQMKLYALGAISEFEMVYDFKGVQMNIYQPRIGNISMFEMSTKNLLNWAETVVKPIAKLAYEGKGTIKAGEHCRFCLAAPKCRARAEKFCDTHKFIKVQPNLLSDEEVNELLPELAQTIAWANSVLAYAEQEALNGKKWNGFKLVEGRSNRKYSDETKVADACAKAGYKDIYKKTLLPITELEKLMGKKLFAEAIGDLVIKPVGKLTLVANSDKRMAVDVTAVNDFNEIKED